MPTFMNQPLFIIDNYHRSIENSLVSALSPPVNFAQPWLSHRISEITFPRDPLMGCSLIEFLIEFNLITLFS